jgi:hypothetical protein
LSSYIEEDNRVNHKRYLLTTLYMIPAVGKEILVNSAILACGSEYFHKMFSAGMTEAMNKSRPIDIHLSLDGKDFVVRLSSLNALTFTKAIE